MSCIYKITNAINGKQYVGQTKDFRRRKVQHLRAINSSAIASSIKKYGASAFQFEVVEYCDHAVVDEREVYWISELDTMYPNGYNLKTGGTAGNKFSAETRAKMSAKKLGKKFSAERRAKMVGRKFPRSLEYRKKISARQTGRIMSPASIAKTAAANRGQARPEEARRKTSEALKGRPIGPHSVERRAAIKAGMTAEGRERTIAALVAATTGKKRGPHSEEHREKIRAANLGQKRSPEARARMSESRKAYIAKMRYADSAVI